MMRTNFPSQAEMHEQHLRWRSERAAWLDDVETWRAQEARALAELARVEAAIRDHGAALIDHARALRALEAEGGVHERQLHELAETGLGDQYDSLTSAHQACARQHEEAGAAHAQLKQRHHQALAEVRRLSREAAG